MPAHILILDDDVEDMDLLQQCFSIENFKNVIFFTKASAALAFLLSTTDLPSLIVTDCHMPENSGVEFVATVRARDKLSHLRTAMLCGGITPKEREALLNVGVEKLYIKPSTFEGLHNVVKEIIQLAHTACGLTGTYLL